MKHGRFKGKTFDVWALTIQNLARCQDEAVQEYKRQYIETFTRNVDLMPPEQRDAMIAKAFESASKMTYADLPKKTANFPIFTAAGEFLRDERGDLVLREQELEYMLWWLGDTLRGRLYATWLSLTHAPQQRHLTLDNVDAIFLESQEDLREIVDLISQLTQPKVELGNGLEPEPEATVPARRRKRRRR